MINLRRKLLVLTVAGIVSGCAATDKEAASEMEQNLDIAALTGSGFMATCDNPSMDESGPVAEALYVVGSFADSGWKHKKSRKMNYVGNNTYQLVFEEKAGNYKMQFASSDWSPQYSTDGLVFTPGAENVAKYGGLGKDAKVSLPVSGRYVWSLELNEQQEAVRAVVSLCK